MISDWMGCSTQYSKTGSAEVANKTVYKIWEIWLENDDGQTQERLAQGIAAMDRNPPEALLIFNKLIVDAPEIRRRLEQTRNALLSPW